jgi:hypothetical protein
MVFLALLALPVAVLAQGMEEATGVVAPLPDAEQPTADGGSKASQLAEIDALEPAVNVSQSEPVPAEAARRSVIQRSAAMDELDLGTTSITGNQELPKVLYIVPWKKSDLGDLVGRPVNTLLDEVLAPVDPEVFERHLDYYDALHGAGAQE